MCLENLQSKGTVCQPPLCANCHVLITVVHAALMLQSPSQGHDYQIHLQATNDNVDQCRL